ncbi:MAG: PEP-CTERM sorting domain-containing protein, partial [Planctomycetota bacterium]
GSDEVLSHNARLAVGLTPTESFIVTDSSAISRASLSNPNGATQLIDTATSEGIDQDLLFNVDTGTLGSDPAAFGMLWSLSSSNPSIADSETFGILLNFGLDESEFENGVEHFVQTRGLSVTAIPEPSSALLMLGVGLAFSLRRRSFSDARDGTFLF